MLKLEGILESIQSSLLVVTRVLVCKQEKSFLVEFYSKHILLEDIWVAHRIICGTKL